MPPFRFPPSPTFGDSFDSVKQEDYDTVFYPGGHGPMWDLAEDLNSIKLIESFLAAGKPVALVCHAPGVLRHVKMTHLGHLPHYSASLMSSSVGGILDERL
jgi:putative intracellular protease/amidase